MSDVGHSTTGPAGRHTSRTLKSLSMEGKVCVVTGGARGLGNLFARTFVESGSNSIVIVDLIEEQAQKAAEELTAWFVEHGEAQPDEIQAVGFGCDVSNEDSVKHTMQRIVDKFGRIDALVCSAGIVHNYSALEYPTDKMRMVFKINVEGAFFCAREAARHMFAAQTQTGSIILVGSMSGSVVNVPQPQTPYNSSKAAVRQMAASLAVEWAQSGVRVNSLAPGYMLTALTKNILDANPALREKWESLTPMGRIGLPEDLKGAIVYLASDASGFTTGQELIVDGGYTLT